MEVIDGWVTEAKMIRGTLEDDEVAEIVRRRAICEDCPFNSKNAKKDGWYTSERTDDHCTMCSCPIISKTSCLPCSCGIQSHNDANPDKKMELKWTKYEPTK